jgi:hypothetical protein
MKHIEIIVIALSVMLPAGPAVAAAGNCKPAADQTGCAKKRVVPPRRAVPQKFEPLVPMQTAPASRPAAAPPVPPSTAQTPAPPQRPFSITTCDAGGCWGPDGKRYNSGAGNAYLDSNGRFCQRTGTWMQCS